MPTCLRDGLCGGSLCPVCTDRFGEPKRIFRSRAGAEAVALRLHVRTGAAMSGYPCPHGHGFHAGHTPAALREAGIGTRRIA